MKPFVISDLHLGHANILLLEPKRSLYSSSVEVMNQMLIKNWNACVKEGDVTYHLGDFAFGKGSRFHIPYWVANLNGFKVWIRGNHYDPRPNMNAAILRRGGFTFVLIHDPKKWEWPLSKDQWIIHGHYHSKSPLVDWERKWINVSVENIHYKPMQLDEIVELIRRGKELIRGGVISE